MTNAMRRRDTDSAQERTHTVAGEQLGAQGMVVARGDDREALNRGRQDHVIELQRVILEQVDEPPFDRQLKKLRDGRLGGIGVDQNDGVIALGCEAEGQIERHEGFPFALARARHHDQVGVGGALGPGLVGTFQQRAFDQPELLRGPVDVAAGREHPRARQPSGIDLDLGRGRIARGASAGADRLGRSEDGADGPAGRLEIIDRGARPGRARQRAHFGDRAFHDRAGPSAIGLDPRRS
jgi:hypothetical protein